MKSTSHSAIHAIIAIAVALAVCVPPVNARKIKTKHSIPKTSAKETTVAESNGFQRVSIETDSIDFCERILPAIRFYGFDKTVTSSIESLFISNGLDQALEGMEIQITYTDMKGRQLHKRTVRLDCTIPPHETQRTDFKSWDTQKSFYFRDSVKPKRQATPFDVHIDLLSVAL